MQLPTTKAMSHYSKGSSRRLADRSPSAADGSAATAAPGSTRNIGVHATDSAPHFVSLPSSGAGCARGGVANTHGGEEASSCAHPAAHNDARNRSAPSVSLGLLGASSSPSGSVSARALSHVPLLAAARLQGCDAKLGMPDGFVRSGSNASRGRRTRIGGLSPTLRALHIGLVRAGLCPCPPCAAGVAACAPSARPPTCVAGEFAPAASGSARAAAAASSAARGSAAAAACASICWKTARRPRHAAPEQGLSRRALWGPRGSGGAVRADPVAARGAGGAVEGAGEAAGSSPPFSLLPRFNASRGLRDGGRLPLPAFWGPLSSGLVSQWGP